MDHTKEQPSAVEQVKNKLQKEGLSEAAIKAFMFNYDRLSGGETGKRNAQMLSCSEWGLIRTRI